MERNPFALRCIVVALAGAGLMTGAPVMAQEGNTSTSTDADQATANNIVVVSGQRQAAQSAQAIKQNAEQVVDSIVAEDIGKFPDKNVAELLGRITGVQTVRENGEAGRIVIRGLGGTTTLFNGREMFTAASRSLNLTDVPVSMLQRVDVYKSQGADMVEGGTSGVIDVRTFRPFDFKGAQYGVNARAEHRDKAGQTDPQLSGLWSNRWKTDMGEFGLLGGLSYQRGRYHDEVAWAGQPTTYTLPAGVQGSDGNGRVMTTGDRKRLAANVSAQWRPNRDVEVYAEGFSTKIDHDSQSVFFVGGFPINDPASTVTTVPGAGGAQYLDSISNPNSTSLILSSTQARRDWSRGSQGAIGATWDAGPALRLSTELVRTVSTYRQANPILDSTYNTPRAVVGGTRDGGGYVDYPGTDLRDPSKWTMIALYDNHNRSNGAANDWRGDVNWTPADLGVLKELSGGLRWAQRDAAYAHELNNYRPATITGVSPAGVPGLSCLSPELHGNYGVNQYYASCMNFLLDNTGAVRQAILGTTQGLPDDPLSYYTDRETTNAIYGKARIGFDVFGVPVDGSAGVRVVRTKQAIVGNSRTGDNGAVTPVSVSGSDTDVLPSLNLRANFRHDLVGRLIAGKAIERAAFGDYNPGTVLGSTTTTNANPPNGTAGNPNLKPQEARNLDVALEWYFSKDGSLTGTAFQHKFKNYLRHQTTLENINGINYLVDRPYNTDTAKLYGFEAAYQQFFPWLPGWLGGLGAQVNATYMNGGMTEPDGSRNTFPGMSKTAYNVVGMYERGPWSARVAYSWRDQFVDTYNYRGLGVNLIVDPIKTLDASVSYKITQNLVVTLDGSNLLNQTYRDYHGVPELPRDVRRYDKVIGLALRWRN
jgi:iron complex outermembrane receptor protein